LVFYICDHIRCMTCMGYPLSRVPAEWYASPTKETPYMSTYYLHISTCHIIQHTHILIPTPVYIAQFSRLHCIVSFYTTTDRIRTTVWQENGGSLMTRAYISASRYHHSLGDYRVSISLLDDAL
jgi:hypothetical protein